MGGWAERVDRGDKGQGRGEGWGREKESRERGGRDGVGVWRVTLLLQILVSPIPSSW